MNSFVPKEQKEPAQKVGVERIVNDSTSQELGEWLAQHKA